MKLDIDSLQSTAMSDELQNKDLHLQNKVRLAFQILQMQRCLSIMIWCELYRYEG